MPVTDQSKDAFNDIKDSIGLKGRKFTLQRNLAEEGPCTANELYIRCGGGSPFINHNTHSCLNQMRDLEGSVRTIGKRKCTTEKNRVAYVWEALKQPWTVPPKKVKCPCCSKKGFAADFKYDYSEGDGFDGETQ